MAQIVDTGTQTGSLATTADSVTISAGGNVFANVRFSVTSAGTATVTAEVSIDGGVNYIAAPYAKRTDAVSSNPTVQAISSSTLTAGQSWEVPLPGNATHFRLRCVGAGTASVVTMSGGQLYVPGSPVLATLYDVTSGVNSNNITPTLDATGWANLPVIYSSGGGTTGAVVISPVLDDGTAVGGNTLISAAATGYAIVGRTVPYSSTAPAVLPRRVTLTAAAVVAQQTRLVVYAVR